MKWEEDKDGYVKKVLEALKKSFPQCEFKDIDFGDFDDEFRMYFSCEKPDRLQGVWKFKKPYVQFYFFKQDKVNYCSIEVDTQSDGVIKVLGKIFPAKYKAEEFAEIQIHNMEIVSKWIAKNAGIFFYS